MYLELAATDQQVASRPCLCWRNIASIRPPSKQSRCRIHRAPRDPTAGFGQDHNQYVNTPLGGDWVGDLGREHSPATLVMLSSPPTDKTNPENEEKKAACFVGNPDVGSCLFYLTPCVSGALRTSAPARPMSCFRYLRTDAGLVRRRLPWCWVVKSRATVVLLPGAVVFSRKITEATVVVANSCSRCEIIKIVFLSQHFSQPSRTATTVLRGLLPVAADVPASGKRSTALTLGGEMPSSGLVLSGCERFTLVKMPQTYR